MIEHQNGKDKLKNEHHFSLRKRLEAEAPDPQKEMVLEDLFNSRALRNVSLGKPNRVLIRGRAGVGKTTLCKKIVHTFLLKQLWISEYDRIIWISLRIEKVPDGLDELAGDRQSSMTLDTF